jgi:hypothetical protein
VKSLRSTGSPAADRAASRSVGEPPKYSRSVRTDRHVAPPAAYAVATSTGSRSGASGPFDGERRLTSAITATPPVAAVASAAANPRAGGRSAAANRSPATSRSSAAAAFRWAATISVRYVGMVVPA